MNGFVAVNLGGMNPRTDIVNSPLKAAHVLASWLPQTQTWICSQVKHLPPCVEAHVICEATQNLDQFHVPNIHCLRDASPLRNVWDRGLRKVGARRHLGFLKAAIQGLKISVVHSHFGYVGCDSLGALDGTNARHVVTFYGADVTQVPRSSPDVVARYQRMFAAVDRVLCEGPVMAGRVVALGCPREKVMVHHLGVPVDRLMYRPRQWNQQEPLRILIAGTFREKKGIPYAVRALGRIRRDVDLDITIIGDATNKAGDAEEKAKIRALIDQCGLQARTRMLGFQPHNRFLEEAYRHHIFLSPSVTAEDGDTEGGAPVTIIEMAATGMPVVSTRHCDIPGVVVHGETGRLADERDVDGLVEQLDWLVRSPNRWPDMIRSARQRIEREFNCQTQGIRLAEVYAELRQSDPLNV